MIKLNKFLMMSVLSFGLISSYLVAEDTTSGTVEAEVLAQDGSAVSGATVTLKSTSKGLSRSSVADNDGSVRFVLLPPGSYSVSVAASGFKSLSDVIRVSVGDSTFDFVLESMNADIDEVVVTAGAIEGTDFNNTTTGISVDVDEIMTTTPLSRNLTSIVLLAPGTSKGDSAFGNLASISGSSVAENVYLINGPSIGRDLRSCHVFRTIGSLLSWCCVSCRGNVRLAQPGYEPCVVGGVYPPCVATQGGHTTEGV